MTLDAETLIYAALFLGVFLATTALALLLRGALGGGADPAERRLARYGRGARPESEIIALRRARRNERKGGLVAALKEKAAQADLGFGAPLLALLFLLIAVLIYALALRQIPIAAPMRAVLALALAYFALWFWLNGRVQARRRAFTEQLPDALEAIARSLKIGMPLGGAIQSVARNMPAPIGPEFATIAQEVTYGMSVAEAVDRMSERQQSKDLRFLAVALSIHSQSGGNLSEVLENLAGVVRARFRMAHRVRSATAEARWSGWFLSAFPVVMIYLIQLVRPDYFEDAKQIENFNVWVAIIAVMLVANIVFMRLASRVKV